MARKIFDLCYTQNRELSWLKFNQHVLEDNVKARRLCAEGNYVPVGAEGLCDVQQYYLEHLPAFRSTVQKQKGLGRLLQLFKHHIKTI